MSDIREYKQPKNKIEKGLLYLQHYGLKKTVAKTIRKALGHDQEHYSYAQFLKAHPVTEKDLEKQRHTIFKFNPVGFNGLLI